MLWVDSILQLSANRAGICPRLQSNVHALWYALSHRVTQMLNKPHHVQITFSHSIVLTMEQQRERVITQCGTHRKIAITSLKACHLRTRSGFPSHYLPLCLLKNHSFTDKLLGLQYGRLFFRNASTATISLWHLTSVCDEAIVELSTRPPWEKPMENTQPSSNILSEKGWIDKAAVMVPAKRDNYLQPPDREQQ